LKPPKGLLLLLFACLCASGLSARAEVGFSFSLRDERSPQPYLNFPRHGLSMDTTRGIFPLSGEFRKVTVTFDSLYTQAEIGIRGSSQNLYQPLVLDYAKYRDLRYAHDMRKEFREITLKDFKAAAQQRSGEGIAIDVPFRIKSKTFRRIFGGDNIGLRVQGTITIDGKLRQQKFDELQAANQRNSNTNFNIDMTQRFTIAGKIGEKVQVDVNQDSERLFDFENSLKLTYTGDKDEIVQKVEAGNVSLNLGTRLATFSGQNKGLFGLKTEAKVGGLKLTGIASLERGQKNKQRPNDDARRAQWSENDFLQNVYFWITDKDTTVDQETVPKIVPGYRENYRKLRVAARQHVVAPITIEDIQVWVTQAAQGGGQGIQTSPGIAVAMQNYDHLYLPESEIQDSPNEVSSTFRRLTPETDYQLDKQLGFIRLKTPLQNGVALACAFVTSDGSTFGTMTPDSNGLFRLILLRSQNPAPADYTWNLMFRHVYSVQTTDIDPNNFQLKIIRGEANAGGEEEGLATGESYLSFFRFDLEGNNGGTTADGLVDNYDAVVDAAHGELHFLDLTPFSPSGVYDVSSQTPNDLVYLWDLQALEASDSLGYIDSTLYTQPASQVATGGRKWRFVTEYKGTTSQYDLGPLVLEGSEEVTLNGVPLTRGSDYTIDYLSGQLKILNDQAKTANANLEITYESGQVFQLDRKTLLGARAEYELWQDSYVGGMWLYLNEKSLDKRVRIGNEPIRNTLYDINTQLKFKPNFLTAIADRLPLVRTNAPSEFSVDGEVAQVFPNPNSLSNSATGDDNGVAFLDDFEASRRSSPLGLLRKNWSTSSFPEESGVDSLRGRMRWWNPRPDDQNDVKVRDVYPERQTNSQVADRLQSLILEFEPDQSTGNPQSSWGGVMRYLGTGYEDQSRAQFLEFWVLLPSREGGKLVVDLGSISEDALPNDSMDTEDLPAEGVEVISPRREYGNGVLTPAEDTGIDGVDANDPEDVAFWNGPTRPPVPSWDDWQYTIGTSDFDQINGTENSLNDESGNIPDSEDLNGNGTLDQANDFFSYTIDLSESNPFIVGGQNNEKRWRLFRIPLDTNDPSVLRTTGAPTMTNIRFARMYLTNCTETTRIQLVQNDIVANEWLPQYVDADSTEFLSVAVINNHENAGYESPPGVQGEIDPITNLRQREQSLVLSINELGGATAPTEFFVAKNLYQQLNLIEYKRLKMFAHGGGIDEALFEDEQYQLILRLGSSYSNTNSNYYDIVKTIYKGWDPRNTIDVAMNDLSILNAWRQDSLRADWDRDVATRNGYYGVVLDSINFPQDSLIIEGRPSLQNVGFIAIGIRAKKHYNNIGDEIWIDELRVSDIYKDPGVAGEINGSLKIADLATFNGAYSERDADFHNVNTRTGSQAASQQIRGSMTLALQKFGLEDYGFQLPFSVNRTETEDVPKYVPNTDARVNQDNPDPDVITTSSTTTYNASFAKTGNSKNPLLRWTVEKLRLGWDHSESSRQDYLTKTQTQSTTNARADYTFPTASGRGIAPLWFLKATPILSRLGNPKIFFKPKQLTGTMSARRANSERITRAGQRSVSPDFGVQASGSVGWDITQTLGTGFASSYGWTQLDVDTIVTGGPRDSLVARARPWSNLTNLNRRDLTAEGLNWVNTYSPQFGRWLQPSFNYNSSYTFGNANRSNAASQSVSNNSTLGSDLSLDFKQIFGGGGGQRRGDARDRQKPKPKPTHADSTQTDSTAAAPSGGGSGFSPMKLLGKAVWPVKTTLLLLDPIQLSVDKTTRHAQAAVLGQANLRYRLGMSTKPGVATDTTVVANPQTNDTKDFTARSGIRFSRDIRTSLSWSLRTSKNEAQTITGSNEQSFFWIADDNGILTELPFPDVTVDWSGLERLPFISKAARTVSLNSGLSTRFKEDWKNDESNIEARNYTRQWNPLVGVNVSWLNGLESQFRINASNTLTEGVAQGLKQRAGTRGATGTVSYTMRSGFRLPILWFGSMRLENSTTFSLNLDYQTTINENTQSATKNNWTTRRDEVQWSVQPSMNYSFSNTVQGGARLQYQQTKDKITDKGSRLFEFGINVNIAIRG